MSERGTAGPPPGSTSRRVPDHGKREQVTTTATTGRTRQRKGDLIFSGATRIAGLTILLALAGVAIFLTLEGLPALEAGPEQAAGRRQHRRLHLAAALRHAARRGDRAPHRHPAGGGRGPGDLALRAAPGRARASATRSTCSPPSPASSTASGASASSARSWSRSTSGSSRTSAGCRSSPAPPPRPARPSSPRASCSRSWRCRSSPRSAARSSRRPPPSTRRRRSRSARPAGR